MMKRCTTAHEAPGFGLIPAGSLWADDSPYLTDDNAGNFVDATEPEPELVDATEPEPEPVKAKPVRKSNLTKKAAR